MHSISTRALRGNAATATVERAGYGSEKYFAMSSLTLAKFTKSVMKIVTFTTCANVPPAVLDFLGLEVENARRCVLAQAAPRLLREALALVEQESTQV